MQNITQQAESLAATRRTASQPRATYEDRLLTPEETAVRLHCTTGTLTVWRCTKRYPLSYIKIGGKVRYRESDVETFLVARRVEPQGRAGAIGTRRTRRGSR